MKNLDSAEDRCSGHCCRNFSLSLSPDGLKNMYRRWKMTGPRSPDTIPMGGMQSQPPDIWDPDIHIIALMCVYLGSEASSPKFVNKHEAGDDKYRYRCKHWDSKTRDCTIYDDRPQMCRVYPGIGGCNYASCTWETEKREKRKITSESVTQINYLPTKANTKRRLNQERLRVDKDI